MDLLNIVSIVIFPLFLYWLGFRNSKSKINLVLKLLIVGTYFLFIFYTGRWDLLSYYLRYIFLFLLILVTIKAFAQFKTLVLVEKKKLGGWVKSIGQFLFLVLLFCGCIEVINGFSTDEKGIDLAFPITEGFIGHGGNSVLINYHHSDITSQQYALDIVKLNSWGLITTSFFSNDLKKYVIYGDTIYSPCDGKIVKAQDGLDNVSLGVIDNLNPAGNHIILEYENNLILMAHMLKGSILVSTGNFVKKDQPIARVGNSGRTRLPHLHMHAIAGTDISKIIFGGNGIPIYFNGKFPIRNERIKK